MSRSKGRRNRTEKKPKKPRLTNPDRTNDLIKRTKKKRGGKEREEEEDLNGNVGRCQSFFSISLASPLRSAGCSWYLASRSCNTTRTRYGGRAERNKTKKKLGRVRGGMGGTGCKDGQVMHGVRRTSVQQAQTDARYDEKDFYDEKGSHIYVTVERMAI